MVMENRLSFDYFYGYQADKYVFYRIPKVLFTGAMFSQLSCEAKVLYGLMLDRMSLSVKEGWLDEEKRVFIIYTIEEITETIGCARQKAVRLLKELDETSGIGLIKKKRRGQGKANIIYVKNFIINNTSEVITEYENNHSEINECFLQALFGQSCKTFLDIVACPNWTKLQSLG